MTARHKFVDLLELRLRLLLNDWVCCLSAANCRKPPMLESRRQESDFGSSELRGVGLRSEQ